MKSGSRTRAQSARGILLRERARLRTVRRKKWSSLSATRSAHGSEALLGCVADEEEAAEAQVTAPRPVAAVEVAVDGAIMTLTVTLTWDREGRRQQRRHRQDGLSSD